MFQHHTNSDPTNAGVAAAPWPNLFGAMGHSHPSAPHSIPEELISAPGHIFTTGSEISIFNAADDIAFMPAPTTSMGTFTNLPNYTYPVSRRWFDRRHWLTLPRYRMSPILGPCWRHVRPILDSATDLRVQRMQ
jgi:hypothetical protein